MSSNQLKSDSSTYVKKRAQRSDESILLSHMGDEMELRPDEHLMNDFEHMKTNLYAVNFLDLETFLTSMDFEEKNSTDLLKSHLNFYDFKKLEIDSASW